MPRASQSRGSGPSTEESLTVVANAFLGKSPVVAQCEIVDPGAHVARHTTDEDAQWARLLSSEDPVANRR